MLREYRWEDEDTLRKIHAKYFAQEFSFPDFATGFLCAFTIEDENGIITTGGIRPLAEAIVITNKERNVYDRRQSLLQILDALAYCAGSSGFRQMTAFVQDKKWEKRLIRSGFNYTKGTSLYLNL